MSETEKKCTSVKVPDVSDELLKVAAKFRAYRLEAEFTDGKLKEAEFVIEQLKNELKCSRDMEKNLTGQIISAEGRFICLQETLKKFLTVFDRQRQNEKASQTIERKLEDFRKKIDRTRQETENLIERVTIDGELQKKNKSLESTLAVLRKENDLMKVEIQNWQKEKKNMETEFQQKLKNLESDLEEAVKKETQTETHYFEMLLNYKEQIKEYKQKVEHYEKERKSLLEDFELPISSSGNIVRAESAAILNAENRSPDSLNSKNRNTAAQETDEECDTRAFQCSGFQGKPKRVCFKKEKATNFSKMTKKQKPQLEFLTASQYSLRTPCSVKTGQKRRLFSTNCNHYID